MLFDILKLSLQKHCFCERKKNQVKLLFSVYLLHLFCAVTMYDTRVEALPIMYGQRRTDLPSSSDLQSVCLEAHSVDLVRGQYLPKLYIASCLTSVHTRFVQ